MFFLIFILILFLLYIFTIMFILVLIYFYSEFTKPRIEEPLLLPKLKTVEVE